MPGLTLDAVAVAFTIAVLLLVQFHQERMSSDRLAALGLGEPLLLGVLVALLPWIEKGSFLAFVVGYVLVTVLLVNMLMLFVVANLPGQQRVKLSVASTKSCWVLLKLVGTGLGVWLKGLVKLLGWGLTQVQALILWAVCPQVWAG